MHEMNDSLKYDRSQKKKNSIFSYDKRYGKSQVEIAETDLKDEELEQVKRTIRFEIEKRTKRMGSSLLLSHWCSPPPQFYSSNNIWSRAIRSVPSNM